MAALTPLVVLLTAGCAVQTAEPGVGEAEEAVVTDNAMLPNAMLPNAMLPNAMLPNAMLPNSLAPNAMLPNAMLPNALATIVDPGDTGATARMFVKYAVSCAFNPDQAFDFTWTDSSGVAHDEHYVGSLGLAPAWATGPLSDTGQRSVTACLAARTNLFGVSVMVSLRSEIEAVERQTTAAELAAYPYVEGAFWGNVFSTTPYARACHVEANVDHDRAAGRYCAAGYPGPTTGQITECGIIDIVGHCPSLCSSIDATSGAYKRCRDPLTGTWVSLLVTTALR